jgi:hypothetical protein
VSPNKRTVHAATGLQPVASTRDALSKKSGGVEDWGGLVENIADIERAGI